MTSFTESPGIVFIQEVESGDDSPFAEEVFAVSVKIPIARRERLMAPRSHFSQLLA
ncbi:MAG TPA: hypothetical protein VGQ93_17865 [Lysobacter sp.]|nr:hypothetical protein [Lysobacter sp.]